MKRYNYFITIVILLFGSFLLHYGCGDDDDDSTEPTATPSQYYRHFYGWTGAEGSFPYSLVWINVNNGAVSRIGGNNFFSSLNYGPDWTLYGIDDGLNVIDPTSGNVTRLFDFSDADDSYILMTDAAFDADGTLYAVSDEKLYIINITAQSVTALGTKDEIWSAMEFIEGILCGAYLKLFHINPQSGSVSNTIGLLDHKAGSFAFNDSGSLVSIDRFPSTSLRTLDIQSGESLSQLDLSDPGVVAIVPQKSVDTASQQRFEEHQAVFGDYHQERDELDRHYTRFREMIMSSKK